MATITNIVDTLYNIYFYMIIAYVLLSWLPNARESFIGEMLGKAVEPYLSPFRRFIPPIAGIIDISPIVALLSLWFLVRGLLVVIGFFVP